MQVRNDLIIDVFECDITMRGGFFSAGWIWDYGTYPLGAEEDVGAVGSGVPP